MTLPVASSPDASKIASPQTIALRRTALWAAALNFSAPPVSFPASHISIATAPLQKSD